jgi:group I intron endonuclease
MIGVYKITNPSNKVYVGQSTDIEKRFLGYRKMKCKQQIKLFNSFRKYGVDSHKFEIIVECEVNELNNLERHYQEFYNVIGEKGLNLKLTKTDDRSGFMSKETKEKMSFSSLGNTISEDAKKKISESKLGVKNPMFGKFGNTHRFKYNGILFNPKYSS